MPKLTAKEFQEKWAKRLKAAVDDVRAGIDKVTVAPGELAAAKKEKWIAKMTSSEVQEKWARAVAAVSLEEWKKRARDVGAGRIPGGVDAATDKMVKFGEALLSYQESKLPEVHRMADITREDMRARMNKWFDIMSAFKYK